LSHIGLYETRFMPSLEQGIEQNSLFALDAVHFSPDSRAFATQNIS
jgi:hypothetical protein